MAALGPLLGSLRQGGQGNSRGVLCQSEGGMLSPERPIQKAPRRGVWGLPWGLIFRISVSVCVFKFVCVCLCGYLLLPYRWSPCVLHSHGYAGPAWSPRLDDQPFRISIFKALLDILWRNLEELQLPPPDTRGVYKKQKKMPKG